MVGLVSSSTIRGEKTTGHCQPSLSGGRNEIEYSVCTKTTAIPAIGTSGNSSPRPRDHCCAKFDRRLRRLLAGAAGIETAAIPNCGPLPAAFLATPVAEPCFDLPRGGAFRRPRKNPRTRDHCWAKFDRRLRRLLAGAAGIETGAAVIEIGAAVIGNCGQLPAGFLATPVAEICFDQITTDRCNYPGVRTSLVSSVAYGRWAARLLLPWRRTRQSWRRPR